MTWERRRPRRPGSGVPVLIRADKRKACALYKKALDEFLPPDYSAVTV